MDLKFNLPYHEKWSAGKLSKLGFLPMRLFIWVSQLHLEMHQCSSHYLLHTNRENRRPSVCRLY